MVVWSPLFIIKNLFRWVLIIVSHVTALNSRITRTKARVIVFSRIDLFADIRIILNCHQVIKCLLNWSGSTAFIISLSLFSYTVLFLIVYSIQLTQLNWLLASLLSIDWRSLCFDCASFTFMIDIIMNIWANDIQLNGPFLRLLFCWLPLIEYLSRVIFIRFELNDLLFELLLGILFTAI